MVLDVIFNVNSQTVNFEDATTQGEFTGVVTITHPDGFVVTLNISDISPSNDTPMRTDSDGNYLQGLYVFSYVNDAGVSEVNSINLHYVAPVANLECKIDYLCSKLTVTDKTSYSIAGVSQLNTSFERDITISYPAATGLSDINSETTVTVVNPIYTGTFGIVLSTVVTFGFEGYAIVDVIEGNKECKVDEGDSLCSLKCCMVESFNRWINARCTNNRRAAEFEEAFKRVTSIVTLAYISLSCGDTKGVEGYVAEAKKIAGCGDCDCGGGGTGALVVGLCGASVSGEVDVEAGTGIIITEGGVINVDADWLANFVNNIISGLDLSELEGEVTANSEAIAQLQTDLTNGLTFVDNMNALLQNISVRFTNHNILSFSYRFGWVSGVLTDNRNAQNFVSDGFVQRMNGTGVAGWLANPKVTWVNAPTSNAAAELEVELLGLEGALPTTAFNNLNVVCEFIGRTASPNNSLGRIRPVVYAIGTGGENTLLRFKVRFWSENFGYISQSFLSNNTSNIGGDAHLSFFVTGKN